MRRRLLGILLIIFGVMAPLLVPAPAHADLIDAQTIFTWRPNHYVHVVNFPNPQLYTNNVPEFTFNCTPTGTGKYSCAPFEFQIGIDNGAKAPDGYDRVGWCGPRLTFDQNSAVGTVTFRTKDQALGTSGAYSCKVTGSAKVNVGGTDIAPGDLKDLGGAEDACNTARGCKPVPGQYRGVNVPATCNAGPYFSWLICDIIIMPAVRAIDWVRDKLLVPLLREKPMDTSDPSVKPIYEIWATMRNVASLFFILIFFIVILGNAWGMDNYTVKKILPRLVAGAILIPFSWWICVLLVDFGNVLGGGLSALTSAALGDNQPEINFQSNLSKLVLAGFLAGTAAIASTAIATLGAGVIASVVIAVFLTFFTLILRKILITLLIIVSPFALVLYVLPNTEKWFKEWWSNLLKLILMYPLIMLLFEAGRVFAAAAGASPVNPLERSVTGLIQFAAIVMPLFLVPATFSMAGKLFSMGGDALGKVSGALDKRYGKDSAKAKIRAADRKAVNANRAMDALHGPGEVTFGRRLKGAVALKRSGLGTLRQGAGKAAINPHKQLAINQAQTKYQADQGLSQAQDRFRTENAQTSKEAVRNETAGIIDAQMEADTNAAMSSAKTAQGVSQRNTQLTESQNDEAIAKIASARAEFAKNGSAKNQLKLAEALGAADGGIDQLEGMIHTEIAKGDKANKAVITGALRRMSNSYTGFKRASALARGFREDSVENGVLKFKGGNGKNADGSKPLFGGTSRQVVSDEWREVWNRGTKDAPGNDKAKPMTSAAVDMSADQLSNTDPEQIKRYLAFYDQGMDDPDSNVRNAAIKGARDFAIAADDLLNSNEATGQVSTDTKAAIALGAKLRHPVVSEQVAAAWGRTPELEPPDPTTAPAVARNIVAATGNDLHHASQIHAQIQAERAAHPQNVSATHDMLAERLVDKGSLDRADLQAANVAAASALRAGEVAAPTALRQAMAKEFNKNLDQLHEVERRYATDGSYRDLVKDAYVRGRKIPGIPAE
jgi:hypothetical protein